jgi:hypothetical protein
VAAVLLSLGAEKLRLANDLDGFFDVAVGLVDVLECALLETLGEGVVFFPRDIVVSLVEQFNCAVQAAGPVHAGIDGHVIVDVFPVIDGGFLDLRDGVVDFVNGFLFLLAQFSVIGALQMSAGFTQIRQRMEISRVFPRSRRLSRDVCRNEQQRGESSKGKFAQGFHRL